MKKLGTIGGSTIMFSNTKRFVEEDKVLDLSLNSAPCVLVIAESISNNETQIMVEFVRSIKVREKSLLIIAPSYNSTIMTNLALNFVVRVFQQG